LTIPTAFKEAATKLHEHHHSSDYTEILGAPQHIKLSSKCENSVVDWEVNAFENEKTELTDDLGSPQY
jgi:hypothetical protein